MVLSSSYSEETRIALRFEERELGPGRPLKVFSKAFPEPHRVRLHYHESLELNLCRDLRGEVRVGAERRDLSALYLAVIPPLALHSYDIAPCAGRMEILHIAPRYLPPPLDGAAFSALAARAAPFAPLDGAARERVERCVASLAAFARAPDGATPSARCAAAAVILELLSLLPGGAGHPGAADDPVLRRLIDWTEGRLDSPAGLEEAAEWMGMSRSAFCAWFFRNTGTSYGKFAEELRLEAARELLAEGAAVSEAAEAAGYADVSYFIRRFRRRYGSTPGRLFRRARD